MRAPDPCILVIFGATGDLSRRKLIPALYNLDREGMLPPNFAVCAYARREYTDQTFRDYLKDAVAKYSRQRPGDDWNEVAGRIFYVQGDLDDDAGYQRLKQRLAKIETYAGTAGNRLYYLAVGPEHVGAIADGLGRATLLKRAHSGKPWARVVVEKPIGHDLASARALIEQVGVHATEEQTFRIDHYLGKETVQNIMAFRFGNGVFEPIWKRNYVDHVQITVAEEEGVGSRAEYYEGSGALRDMIQNHGLQLLCLIAMEVPGTLSADDIRNEKVKVLHSLRKMGPQDVAAHTVRGQYGPSLDGKLPGYRAEAGVAPESSTETYAALRCYVDSWRWAGVPFLLRTGKRLPRRAPENLGQFVQSQIDFENVLAGLVARFTGAFSFLRLTAQRVAHLPLAGTDAAHIAPEAEMRQIDFRQGNRHQLLTLLPDQLALSHVFP